MSKTNYKRDVIRRLKIIEGHLKKVIQMEEDGRYCIDILQQSLAVQNALKKVDQLILENHLKTCVITAIKKDKSDQAIQELLEVFKKVNK